MTSIITQETFDEIVKYKWSEDCKCDCKRDYKICNFYIGGKSGTATFEKAHSTPPEVRLIFEWQPKIRNWYKLACVRNCVIMENHRFVFDSLEKFIKKVKKLYICPYHAFCPENCPANRITSPEEKCAICLSDVQLHLLEETPCGHHFCLACLDKYTRSQMKKQGNVTCPTCRRNIEHCSECACAKFECGCKDRDDDDDEISDDEE